HRRPRAVPTRRWSDLALLAQPQPTRLGELPHERGALAQIAEQAGAVDRRPAEPCAQGVVVRAQPVEQRLELVEVGEVADPDRAADRKSTRLNSSHAKN